ncbi:MAG TPA: hypothetical protein VMX38_01070 [Verrucomicrobiae bacterium]|nr:hypothetical protein [Verrucomicrobiae bacterium]
MRSLRNGAEKTGRTLAMLMLLALPAAAQLQVGDNVRMSMGGTVGYEYSGSIDQGQSSHGAGFTGNANLTGSYYSPNFLNFNVAPYYNRVQSNSIFGSLTNASGVNAGVNLFAGSHFPGSISYGRTYNSTGEFGIPGSDIGLASTGNNQNFGIGWSAVVPDWPTLSANYMVNNSDSSILGEEGSNTFNNRILTLLSSYKLDGWHFTGQFTHENTDSSFEDFTNPQEGVTHTASSQNNFGATAQHSLPLMGSFGVNFTHVGYGYHYEDSSASSSSGGSNEVNANAAFHPTSKFGMSFTGTYNDSLLGSIPQAVLNTGTPVVMTNLGSFQSVLAGGDFYYQLLKNLGVHADIDHEYQTFLGETYSATQFAGSVNFNFDHTLLKGLSFSLGVVDTAQQESNTGLGYVGTLNYNRKFSGWEIGGNFSYSQNVETALLIYTTSYYSYLGSVKRRISDNSQWLFGYSGSHSGITANSGTTSAAERAFTTIFYRTYNLNAFYTKSDGEAVFTATGLVPVTTGLPTQVLSGSNFTQYKSTGWGFGLGATPLRRLVVSVSFAKSDGSTVDPALSMYTNNTLITSMMQYRLRKIWVNGGYTRLTQNLGVEGSTPANVTSYYIGVSRWFNFF